MAPAANDPRARSRNRSCGKATKRLVEALGLARVVTEGPEKYRASFDSSKVSFPYDALVKARSERDVARTLALANEHGVPVTPRGSGTSLTGSASPFAGGWALDLTRMKRIAIRSEKMMAVVQAGAVVADIQAAAAAEGLFYPPDPSSRKHCAIGGNIACNAGGLSGVKYGVTRDYVLGLEGYLPNGKRSSWGGEYRKFATGYNIRDLWIGSEGTLGVVTKATLRLLPKPEGRWTLVAAFADDEQALGAAQELLEQRLLPAILEYLDANTARCAEEHAGARLFARAAGKPLLLVEFDDHPKLLPAIRRRVMAWARARALAVRQARGEAEAEALWEVRRKCSGAMFALGDAKINEDIVVPQESQRRFARFLAGLQRKWRLPMPTFGHAGDGNFHVNVMYHRDSDEETRRAKKAVSELMDKVVALGGTISGEHGIGLAKSPFLSVGRGPAEIEAMRAIKRALDPKGILNPGKIFEPFDLWSRPPEDVVLPWDKKPPRR